VGTFRKAYTVDGERFELYAEGDDAGVCYQLVDGESLPIGAPFDAIPSRATITVLIRASQGACDADCKGPRPRSGGGPE
jgi:hypothetical protein